MVLRFHVGPLGMRVAHASQETIQRNLNNVWLGVLSSSHVNFIDFSIQETLQIQTTMYLSQVRKILASPLSDVNVGWTR
jgi:hypothetical protein